MLLNMKLIKVVAALFITKSEFVCADCHEDVVTRNNDLYILSDTPVTFGQAQRACNSLQGTIAHITDKEEREFFFSAMAKKYLKDLSVINIRRRFGFFRVENVGQNEYIQYRFERESSSGSFFANTNFTTPVEGQLKKIALYTSPQDGFTQEVNFCRSPIADRIMTSCSGDFQENFIAYGASGSSGNTITIYQFDIAGTSLTSRLSRYSAEIPGYVNTNNSIYLPDISVFVGAQFINNRWIWTNNTEIFDGRFSPPTGYTCAFMAWSLSFDDGNNLVYKDCTTDIAHYVCKIKFEAKMEPVPCDESSIRVEWTSFNLLSERNIKTEAIQVRIFELSRTYNIGPSDSLMVDELDRLSVYTAQIELRFAQCNNSELQTQTTGQTGYETPTPVVGSFVGNISRDFCTLSWTHFVAYTSNLQYQLTPFSNISDETTSDVIVEVNVPSNVIGIKKFEYSISQSVFPPNIEYDLMISAVACGRRSVPSQVSGFCINRRTDIAKFVIFFLLSILGGVVAGLGVMYCIKSRKITKKLFKRYLPKHRDSDKSLDSLSDSDTLSSFDRKRKKFSKKSLKRLKAAVKVLREVPYAIRAKAFGEEFNHSAEVPPFRYNENFEFNRGNVSPRYDNNHDFNASPQGYTGRYIFHDDTTERPFLEIVD